MGVRAAGYIRERLEPCSHTDLRLEDPSTALVLPRRRLRDHLHHRHRHRRHESRCSRPVLGVLCCVVLCWVFPFLRAKTWRKEVRLGREMPWVMNIKTFKFITLVLALTTAMKVGVPGLYLVSGVGCRWVFFVYFSPCKALEEKPDGG